MCSANSQLASKGLSITALRDSPSFGAYFVIYEVFRRKLLPRDNVTSVHVPAPCDPCILIHFAIDTTMSPRVFASLCFSGGMAGVLAWLFVYPLDVIKTHLQAQDFKRPKYAGIVDCARQLHSQHGPRVFFKGLNSCLVRAFPLNGMTFAMYEVTMLLLN